MPMSDQLHILFAEDDELNRLLLGEILEKYGYSYRAAENGWEAVDLFSQESFDAVLLDVQMPLMDGVEAGKHIKEISGSRATSTPLAAISGEALDRVIQQADVFDYELLKPFSPEAVNELLMTMIAASGSVKSRENVPGAKKTMQKRAAGSALTEADLNAVLDKMGSDYEFFTGLLNAFETSSQELIMELQRVIAQRDDENTASLVHKLRGQVAVFNAERALALLQQAKEIGTTPPAEEIIHQVGEEIRLVIEACRAFIKERTQDAHGGRP